MAGRSFLFYMRTCYKEGIFRLTSCCFFVTISTISCLHLWQKFNFLVNDTTSSYVRNFFVFFVTQNTSFEKKGSLSLWSHIVQEIFLFHFQLLTKRILIEMVAVIKQAFHSFHEEKSEKCFFVSVMYNKLFSLLETVFSIQWEFEKRSKNQTRNRTNGTS